MERSGVGAERTTDINIRVGMNSPPAEGTGGDAEITDNQLCGIFPGPGRLGTTSTVTCDGEYLCQKRHTLGCCLYFKLVIFFEHIKFRA